MIYLIAGAPDMGKSTLARKLSQQLGIAYIEIDRLMPEFNMRVRAEFRATKLPVWEKRKQGLILEVNDYLIEQRTYWPFIEDILNDLKEGVVEGTQLSPRLLEHWLKKNRAKAIVVYEPKRGTPLHADLGKHLAQEAGAIGIPVCTSKEAERILGL